MKKTCLILCALMLALIVFLAGCPNNTNPSTPPIPPTPPTPPTPIAPWELVGNAGFSKEKALEVSLALDSKNTPYVAYQDKAGGGKATVMKFDTSTSSWELVGKAGFSTEILNALSFALDSNNTPYVAYEDKAKDRKATVMKFDTSTSSWELVGKAGFSVTSANYISLALDSNDTPYVAYQDGYSLSVGNGGKATVMKFNGTSWELVGSAGFSSTPVRECSLVLDSNNTPYLAYESIASSTDKKATVMKFDTSTSSWELVGKAGFSEGDVLYLSLVLASDDTPYVAYQDSVNGGKATVMKFNGTKWESVGSVGFSARDAFFTSLALDSKDTPHVAYRDAANGGKATVMKFNGTKWESVGSVGFSAGAVNYTSLALDSKDTPYVACSDVNSTEKATLLKYAK